MCRGWFVSRTEIVWEGDSGQFVTVFERAKRAVFFGNMAYSWGSHKGESAGMNSAPLTIGDRL